MILRRVTQHVKAQNWFAVGLDLAIVVVGVFIGIQVANWNEERKEAITHGKLLVRLHEDFSALEPVIAELVAFLRTSHKSTGHVVDALRLDGPPADEHAFRFALARANWVQNVPQIAPSYQELVTTGRLSEIRDDELRRALIRYGDAHQRVERVYPAATSIIFAPGSNYYRAVDWNMNPETWESESGIVSYDWEALRASRAEMQGWVAMQYDLALYAQKELEEVRTVLAIMAKRPP